MLAYNILEAAYAIKYPRAPLPPLVSPAKPKAAVASTPHQPFKILSPKARNYSERHIRTHAYLYILLSRVHRCKNLSPFRRKFRQEHYLPLLQHLTSQPTYNPHLIRLHEYLIMAPSHQLPQPIPKPLRYQISYRLPVPSSPPTEGNILLQMSDVCFYFILLIDDFLLVVFFLLDALDGSYLSRILPELEDEGWATTHLPMPCTLYTPWAFVRRHTTSRFLSHACEYDRYIHRLKSNCNYFTAIIQLLTIDTRIECHYHETPSKG